MNNDTQKKSRSYWFTHELMLIKARKETTAYLYLILTLFTVSIFGFFILRPAFSTISNLQKKLDDNKSVYSALQDKLTALRSLDVQYAELKPDLPLVYAAIPTSAQIPTLTRQVQTLALNNSISLKSFTVAPIQYYPLENGGKLYGYLFSLDVSGTEQNINSFINSLTNFNRMLSIQRIATGKTTKGELELSFSGKAYFQGE